MQLVSHNNLGTTQIKLAMHVLIIGVCLTPAGTDISSWHDIPLYLDNNLVNFICEIPKETAAKMEVATVRMPVGIETALCWQEKPA